MAIMIIMLNHNRDMQRHVEISIIYIYICVCVSQAGEKNTKNPTSPAEHTDPDQKLGEEYMGKGRQRSYNIHLNLPSTTNLPLARVDMRSRGKF